MKAISSVFEDFSKLKVGIIGDVMLDTYVWGQVDRVSPEAPVPVVTLLNKELRIGGAGNVAVNCGALGAQVFLLTVTGKDEDAIQLKKLLSKRKINTDYSFESKDRVTTNKTRILSKNQQMIRLDAEVTSDLNNEEEKLFIDRINKFINGSKPDVIIFEDYNKGVLTEKLIKEIVGVCKTKGIITAVDPKKKNFFSYQNVDIFKPNLKEVRESLGLHFEIPDALLLNKIHNSIKKRLNHKISFITLSEHGVFYQKDKQFDIVPSHIRNIADVSGAGDTVIAVASLVYAITGNTLLMAEIANIAGGLVCEEVGTAVIDKKQLLKECSLLLS